ncbi:unnamed protein product [Camellia sinensis]
MANNGRPEPEQSSEEEEEASSEENEDQEDSESEQNQLKNTSSKKPLSSLKKPVIAQTSTPKPQSSSEDDSGSESDSESDPPPTNPRIKPLASKPMEEDPPKATRKPRSKPGPAKSPAKRPAPSENNSNQESKRARKKAVDSDVVVQEDSTKKTGDDTKKQLFQRLWSEEDEIVILKGMIEYTAKNGSDPLADMNAFYDFIKKSLHIDVSKTQLSEKVRRLKKKYENNASKSKMGEDRTFSKAHEQKAYELSKKIWFGGANSVGVDSPKVNGKTRKNQSQRAIAASPKVDSGKEETKMQVEPSAGVLRSIGFNSSIGQSSLEGGILKDGFHLISGPKKLELEEKWKKLAVEEVELFLKRTQLICEQTKVVLEAIKSSDH